MEIEFLNLNLTEQVRNKITKILEHHTHYDIISIDCNIRIATNITIDYGKFDDSNIYNKININF